MTLSTDELVQRRARALVAHQQVMAEAAHVHRIAAQARRRAAAEPVFASAPGVFATDVRQRVQWVRAS